MLRPRLALCVALLTLRFAWAVERPPYEPAILIREVSVSPAPGEHIKGGSILIRDGRIVAVGEDVEAPPGTRVIDGKGLFAYPGFIDALSRAGVPAAAAAGAAEERRWEDEERSISETPLARTPAANRHGIFARRRVEQLLDLQEDTLDAARRAGFTAAVFAPPTAILGGSASLLTLGNEPLRRSLVQPAVAQMASFAPPPRRELRVRSNYPGTALGVIAHVRQFMSDALWYRNAAEVASKHLSLRGLKPSDADLEAWQDVLAGQPVFWEANRVDEIHRALDLAAEFDFRLVIVGGAEAWKAADRLKEADVPIILQLRTPNAVRKYSFETEKLLEPVADGSIYGAAWEDRPFYPKAAYEVMERRRNEQIDCAKQLEEAGVRWCFSGLGLEKPEQALNALNDRVRRGLSVEAALRALTVAPAQILGVSDELGTLRPEQRANVTLLTQPLGSKGARVHSVLVNGRPFEMHPDSRSSASSAAPWRAPIQAVERTVDKLAKAFTRPSPTKSTTRAAIVQHEPDWPVETDKTREPAIRTNGSVLLTNAYIITIAGEDIPNGSILIQDGKITAVGPDVAAPSGVSVFDLGGRVAMPGIIDPHAHIALDAINEWTLSVTPEVRCRDVIVHDDHFIYTAVAGGVTTIHTMHGSANTIGGQNVILKLKWGRPAADMIVQDVKPTVKFALGENVKRPGQPFNPWDRDAARRFPGTRMGVEAVVRRAFQEARNYTGELAAYREAEKAGRPALPVRRDLRLEALAAILAGDIWINAHCYRADEILRLLDVCEQNGVRIAALHHVLEAYRILPEIHRHGCSISTFADWWAYKIEAYDAVPQNAPLALRYGINATVKSDSADMMRRMNQEAAKCMKFGRLTPREALSLITLNAARIFGLENRLGTLEAGKDGDVAIFSGHPLDTFSRCELTLIDGEVYFQHPDFDPQSGTPTARAVRRFEDYERNTPHRLTGADIRPAAPPGWSGPEASYALVGGTLHPVGGPEIPAGTLILRGERIEAIGRDLVPPPGATVIDVSGLHVWPGFINAATQVGVHEIGAIDVTVDTREPGTIQPDLLAVSAVNPHTAMIEVARAEGILAALVIPSTPAIAGQAGLVHLDGWTMPEMLQEARVGLAVNLPTRPPKPLNEQRWRSPFTEDQDEEEPKADAISKSLQEIDRFFTQARMYALAVRHAEQSGATGPQPDPRLDAMIPYALGEKPVLFVADAYKHILEVLLFAEKHELRPIIVGGRDAWQLAGLLAERKIPVIYSGIFSLPREFDRWDSNYRALSVLQAAGVPFCTAYREADLAKLVPVELGVAVPHGLDPDAAVRAMTLSAAEILGVADQLGSLEAGKLANVVVTSDHACQVTSQVKYAFVRGRPIPLDSKHTRDAARFADRPDPRSPSLPQELRGPARSAR